MATKFTTDVAASCNSERLSTVSTVSTSTTQFEPFHHNERTTKKGTHGVSKFFHSIAYKLKHGLDSVDEETFLRDLGFNLDFVAAVQQPPLTLMEDAALCMQKLERVRKFFVRSKEDRKDEGTIIHVELTITPEERSLDAQGATSSQQMFALTRCFQEYRMLRKLIEFCVSRKHDSDGDSDVPCAFCAEVHLYAMRCWEQPPLLETMILSGLAVMRKSVLTNSMSYFIYLAKSAYPSPSSLPTDTIDSDESSSAASSNTDDQDSQQNRGEKAAAVPFCQGQAELAIILHDFLQLQNHL